MAETPTARIPFRTWQEFARFLTQKGSAEGLFIRTPKPPATGTELGLQFRFPDQTVLDLARRDIVWSDIEARFGGAAGDAVQPIDRDRLCYS